MPQFQWSITDDDAGPSPPAAPVPRKASNALGFGAVRPFRRVSGGDVATDAGEALIRSNLGQILGTRQGEIRWRPSFGASPDDLRHRKMSAALGELAQRRFTINASRWEPRVRILAVNVLKPTLPQGNDLQLEVKWQIGSGQVRSTLLPL